MNEGDDTSTTPLEDPDESITVLEVFGVKLHVRNRRIAEVLMMDAAEALETIVQKSYRFGKDSAEE
jgi:hypothetical protein